MWYYKLQNLRYLFGHNGGDLGVITDMFMSNNTGVGVIVPLIFQITMLLLILKMQYLIIQIIMVLI